MRIQFRKSSESRFTGFYDLPGLGDLHTPSGSNPDNPLILKTLILTFPRRKLGTRNGEQEGA